MTIVTNIIIVIIAIISTVAATLSVIMYVQFQNCQWSRVIMLNILYSRHIFSDPDCLWDLI